MFENFLGELPRISLPRTPVNKGRKRRARVVLAVNRSARTVRAARAQQYKDRGGPSVHVSVTAVVSCLGCIVAQPCRVWIHHNPKGLRNGRKRTTAPCQ